MTHALTLIATALLWTAPAEDRKADTTPDLTGTYTITKGERDGKAIPNEELEGVVIVFTKDKVVTTGKDKKELYAATYTLDSRKTPCKIAMTSISPKKGEKADGVVKLDGDTLTICYALPGGKTPTDFKAGEKQQCFTLKKVKKNTDR